MGLMQSSVTLVGEQIGKQNTELAKKYYLSHFIICFVLIAIFGLLQFKYDRQMIEMYT